MADLQAAAAEQVVGEVGHAAFTALGDDEVRRWEQSCRGLEEDDTSPWAAYEARELMDCVLACLFGEELGQLADPARTWARTNATMGNFTRRLGCLRDLISQESLMSGPESFHRLQEIFDTITIFGTEAAMATLVYDGRDADAAEDPADTTGAEAPAGTAPAEDETGVSTAGRSRRRRSMVLVAAIGAALVVGGVAYALTSGSLPAHHGGTAPGGTSGRAGGTSSTAGAPGAPSAGPGAGTHAGASGQGGGAGATGVSGTPGPSSGKVPARGGSDSGTAGAPGTTGAGTPSSGQGSSGQGSSQQTSGTTAGDGSSGQGQAGTGSESDSISLPGGGSVTVPTLPTVTLPRGTPVTTPTVSVPGQTVQLPGGTTVTIPGVDLGRL